MKVKILKLAVGDLLDGSRFYDRQDHGLGAYFLDTLFSDIDCLQLYAGIHQRLFGTFYRMLSKRFPFAVYYEVELDTAIVYAVLDCRRSPAWIRKQLGRRTKKSLSRKRPLQGRRGKKPE